MRPKLTLGLIVAVALSGCVSANEPGGLIDPESSYGRDDLDGSVKPRRPRQAKPSTESPEPQATTGSFVITVYGGGGPLAGASVTYNGPDRGAVITDAKGRAKATVRPGGYTIEVDACAPEVHVTSGGGASMTVVAGRVTRGTVDGIAWEPRYWPIQHVEASPAPPWSGGFTLRTRVGDRCAGSAPVAERVSLPTWEYVTDAPIRLAGTPSMTTDSKGWLTARFACRGTGDGDIAARDDRLGTWYVSLLWAIDKQGDQRYCR